MSRPPFPQQKSWFARHKLLSVLGGLLLIGAIGAAMGQGDDNKGDDKASSSISTKSPGAPGSSPGKKSGAPEAGTKQKNKAADKKKAPAKQSEAPAQTEEPAPEPEPAPEESAPGIGDAVRSGDLDMRVDSVKTGISHVGAKEFGEDAQGQFVEIQITLTNTGSEESDFFYDSQKLVDDQGRQHSTSSASIYLDSDALLTSINPGNTAQGTLLFDIPKDATPTKLQLEAGMFADMVEVQLTK